MGNDTSAYINQVTDPITRRALSELLERVAGSSDAYPLYIDEAFTTGITIAADGTTGIAITNAFSGVTAISLAGTGSTAGINISGNHTTAITIGDQTTAGIAITGATATGLSITGACSTAAVTIGASGTPAGDFVWYGTTAAYLVRFDANGDTNGSVLIGADTKGLMFNLYGDVTGCGVFWDPSGDTNGALAIGASGGSKGVNFTAYGATNGCSLAWDQSADQLVITQTNAETTGVERTLDISHTHTGIGASAEAFRSVVTSNVALGTYANAIFGKIDLSNSGEVTGLIGAICAEVTMPDTDAPSGGEYAAFEAEFNMAGASVGGRPVIVTEVNVWGGNETEFDANGLLFDVTGVTSGDGSFFRTNAVALNNCDAFLKCRVNGTVYYIPLSDNQAGT
jgi:hypothetical protein